MRELLIGCVFRFRGKGPAGSNLSADGNSLQHYSSVTFMNQWISKIAIAFVAVVVGSLILVWYRVSYRAVEPGLEQGIQTVVKRNPVLQPLLDRAMSDGRLTMTEANAIISAAEKSKVTAK